jgi:iron complex outermembrane receptor protein
VNAAVTKNLSIIGNVTTMHNRDPRGVMVRSSADRSAAMLARYAFNEGSLDGLSLSLGFEHVGRRAGDNSSGFTGASTPGNLIPNQPSFFLPAYTLLNAGIGYSTKQWAVQLNINNVTDKKYIVSSLLRQWVWAGTERNGQLTVTYKF